MRRGFTLVEILVAVVILGILFGTIAILVGPAVRRKGQEARVTSDLRQITAAINVYMSDNDGGYPLGRERSLPPDLPFRYPEWDTDVARADNEYVGEALNYYTYPWPVQCRERKYDFEIKFDPARHPLAVATFFRREFGPETIRRRRRLGRVRMLKTRDWRSLSGFLDGSVRWAPDMDEFRSEAIGFSNFPCRR